MFSSRQILLVSIAAASIAAIAVALAQGAAQPSQSPEQEQYAREVAAQREQLYKEGADKIRPFLDEFNNGRPYADLPLGYMANETPLTLLNPQGQADASGVAEVVRIVFVPADLMDLPAREVTYRWVAQTRGTAEEGSEFVVRMLGGPQESSGEVSFSVFEREYREFPGERYVVHLKNPSGQYKHPAIFAYAPIDAGGRIIANRWTEAQGVAGMAAADVLAQAWNEK